MEYMVSVLWWVVLAGGILIFSAVKKSRNRKAAESGEDLETVRRAVERAAGRAEDDSLVYAHWIEQESYGRTVKTSYFRYAVAFGEQTLRIYPLRVDKKTREAEAGAPLVLSPEQLGKITVKTKGKDGAVNRVEASLGDKKGHAIIQLYVDAVNLRKSRWFPLNILQRERCEEFYHFITALACQVADENPDVDAMLAAEAREGFIGLGAALAIGGALGGIFFPPFGAILCLVGLAMAVSSKLKGAKSSKGLIISILCTVLVAVQCWAFFKYF